MTTEREKMARGDWYTCLDPELERLRIAARTAVHAHNTAAPEKRRTIAPALRALLAHAPPSAIIEAPFHCSYGLNISLGEGVYLNAGCTILDSARVEIGAGSMLGPHVQIYCADHHRDPGKRAKGLEIARPVRIEKDVWIGGGAILLPGVTVGAGAIIGAGSVVTRNVPAGATVAGNPARLVPKRI